MRHLDGDLRCGSRRRLPLFADVGEEVVAQRARFVQRLVAPASVNTDGRSAEERARLGGKRRDRAGQQRGASDAAVANTPFRAGRPMLCEVLAGEVDDDVDALEPRGVDLFTLWTPGDLVWRPSLTADEGAHFVSALLEHAHERAANETTRAGDSDDHHGLATVRAFRSRWADMQDAFRSVRLTQDSGCPTPSPRVRTKYPGSRPRNLERAS